MGRSPIGVLTLCAEGLRVKPGAGAGRGLGRGLDPSREEEETRVVSDWLRTLLVGAGGFVGASLRYQLGGLVHRVVPPEFPWLYRAGERTAEP
jgi:hypothetical protein